MRNREVIICTGWAANTKPATISPTSAGNENKNTPLNIVKNVYEYRIHFTTHLLYISSNKQNGDDFLDFQRACVGVEGGS